MDSLTREQRYYQLRALATRKALEAVYAITFKEHPSDGTPDSEIIKAILNAEYTQATERTLAGA